MNEKNGQFSIFGRPVIFSPSMPTLGDANDLIFVDLSQYAIGLRREMRLEKSISLDGRKIWFLTGFLSALTDCRRGITAITPRNGDSLSWVVGLAERS
jgi:HK97 family phage major capsid protein